MLPFAVVGGLIVSMMVILTIALPSTGVCVCVCVCVCGGGGGGG